MTQDEIIEMARQAHISLVLPASPRALETFTKLVAAKEQKKWEDQTAVEIHEAVLEEREALCEAMRNKEAWNFYDPADTAIKIIRARGES